MMTLQEALNQGYILWDIKYHTGYVSRKINPMSQTVNVAGGSRAGWLYVNLPTYNSTRYCIRQYIKKP